MNRTRSLMALAAMAVIAASSCDLLTPPASTADPNPGEVVVKTAQELELISKRDDPVDVIDGVVPPETSTPVFSANTIVLGAAKYALEIDEAGDFSSPEVVVESDKNRFAVRAALSLGPGIWNWRMRAQKSGEWGPWKSDTFLVRAKCAIPVFDPTGGIFVKAIAVRMSTATSGGVIRYTTDGTSPIAASAAYAGPVTLARGTTLKAATFKTGAVTSDMASSEYQLFAVAMLPVSAGLFTMGSSRNADEQPQHEVSLSSYYLSDREISQGQYRALAFSLPAAGKGVGDEHPVYNVTWYDAAEFCNLLSLAENLEPAYEITARMPATGHSITEASVRAVAGANGYRLPTEAEWEYAARGGASGSGKPFPGAESASSVAWFATNSSDSTHAGGGKAANELGLFDMGGNVKEWCSDAYGGYSADFQTDPRGPASGDQAVARGGAFSGTMEDCRPTRRFATARSVSANNLGFRVARSDLLGEIALVPVPSYPVPGAALEDCTPTLAWSAVVGADHYEIQVAADEASLGAAPLLRADSSTCKLQVLPLKSGRWWRVRSVKANGTASLWSPPRSFTVDWNPSISATSPASGGTTNETSPLLDWSDSALAVAWKLQIASIEGALAGAEEIECSASGYRLTQALANGSQRYWRVRAINEDGVAAPWSQAWSFSVLISTVISISNGIANPLAVTLDGLPAILMEGSSCTLSATSQPVAESWTWYLDGRALAGATGSSYLLRTDSVRTGMHGMTVKATRVGATGSASGSFEKRAWLLPQVSVEGGTFNNGSSDVTVQSFAIGVYEITQAQYKAVTGMNPSRHTGIDERPVEQVTWYDAVEFCNKLSAMEGLAKVYTILSRSPAGGYPITYAVVSADFSQSGYRLPTEDEWLWAARGGQRGSGLTYAGSNVESDVAWNLGTYEDKPTYKAGTKAPNELGLYDMSGNVLEWIWIAPIDSSTVSKLYGGRYYFYNYSPEPDCRIASFNTLIHQGSRSYYGFRVIRR